MASWWRRLFRREQVALEPEPEPPSWPNLDAEVVLLPEPEELLTMSTPEGDALRAKAETLLAAKPALAASRDWYKYWKQNAKANAYGVVYADADGMAATFTQLADAADAKPTPVPPEPTPVPPTVEKYLVVKSRWDSTMTDWRGTFANWGTYANTYDVTTGQRQDAVSLDKNARVSGGKLYLDLKIENFPANGTHPAFSYTGVSLRTPDAIFAPGTRLEWRGSTPGIGRYGVWSASPASGDDSELDFFEQFPVPDRGGRPGHRRFAAIADYSPVTQKMYDIVDLSTGPHDYAIDWAMKANPTSVVYSVDGKVVFTVAADFVTHNGQNVLFQAQCGGVWGGGKYADPSSSYAAPAGSGLPKSNSSMEVESCRVVRDNPAYVAPTGASYGGYGAGYSGEGETPAPVTAEVSSTGKKGKRRR